MVWMNSFRCHSLVLCLGLAVHAQWAPWGSALNQAGHLLIKDGCMYAGSTSGVYRSCNAGQSWQDIDGLAGNLFISCLTAVDSLLFFGTEDPDQGLFVSSNNGNSWTRYENILPDYIVFDVHGFGGSLFAATAGGVGRLGENGAWRDASRGLPDTAGSVRLASLGRILFVGTSEGIYRSGDSGNTWSQSNGGDSSLSRAYVTSLKTAGSRIVASTYNGVYISMDSGSTWTAMHGLGDPFTISLEVSAEHIFASKVQGVFRYSPAQDGWLGVNEGLNNQFRMQITTLIASGGYLYAGNPNEGIRRRPLSEMVSLRPHVRPGPSRFRILGPGSTVRLNLERSRAVELGIFALDGARIATWKGQLGQGLQEIRLEGGHIPKGTYYFREENR